MLDGFNPWQIRVAVIGALGTIFALIGIFGQWFSVTGAGIALSLLSIILLLLLSNRQSYRQSNRVQHDLNKIQRKLDPKHFSVDGVTRAVVPKIGVAYELAKRIQDNPSHYERYALKNKSVSIRDAFALAATQNEFKYLDLMTMITAQRMKMLPLIKRADLQHWNKDALLSIARLQANQRVTESDLQNAIQVFAFSLTFFGSKALSRKDRLLYLESLGELSRFEQQSALAKRFDIQRNQPTHVELMKLNAILDSSDQPYTVWLETLNTLYLSHSFSPIHMDGSSTAKPLDRLGTRPSALFEGPLVSVIIPTFQSGPSLLTAIKSLLEQSWQNLEIIVVDDGSSKEHRKYLEQASNLSPRVKILYQPQNLGAYSARNRGVSEATGEFITVHDDDDWSHGDKIATQAHHLIDNPDAPANMSSLVRVSEQLKLLRINASPAFLQTNFSSLMVRRSVFESIGLWDSVNRGADSEFRDRICKYYGTTVPILDAVPLSFTRTWAGSLTSGELNRGYVDPARLLYSEAYKQWHDAVQNNIELLRPAEPRNFPIPTNMKPGKRNTHLGSFDVVFMTDYRSPTKTLAEIQAYYAAGFRVGFIHAESPLNMHRKSIQNQLFELQLAGKVAQVSLQDTANISFLVVQDPSVITFMDQLTSNLSVENSLLVVDRPPIQENGDTSGYDLQLCIENQDRMFRQRTTVVAGSKDIHTLCTDLITPARVTNRELAEILALP